MARSKGRSTARDALEPSEALSLSVGARRFLLAATGLCGLSSGWAALRLPWRPDAPLALLLWSLAAMNLFTQLALVINGRHARRALTGLVALSLGAGPVFVGAVAVTSVVMVRMYGPLGWGLTVALAAIGWLLLLATLPVGLVGIHLLRSQRLRRRAVTGAPHADA